MKDLLRDSFVNAVAIVVALGIVLYLTSEASRIRAEKAQDVPVQVVEDDVRAEPVGIIELQLADWCGPCKSFKRAGIIAELESSGWTVKYVSNISKKYPSFRVSIDGKTRSWTGYSNKSRFYSTLKRYMKDLGYGPDGKRTA